MARAKVRHQRGSWKWYGVRSLYRLAALGEPKHPDSSYIPGATLVEERIVLVKARSGEEALGKAEKAGKAYARSIRYHNGYGQKVRARMLKALDAYELTSPPGNGMEVFSTTEEIDTSVPDERICERPIGFGESLDKPDPWRRFKFINVEVVRLMLEH
jgi:hypothetical protein